MLRIFGGLFEAGQPVTPDQVIAIDEPSDQEQRRQNIHKLLKEQVPSRGNSPQTESLTNFSRYSRRSEATTPCSCSISSDVMKHSSRDELFLINLDSILLIFSELISCFSLLYRAVLRIRCFFFWGSTMTIVLFPEHLQEFQQGQRTAHQDKHRNISVQWALFQIGNTSRQMRLVTTRIEFKRNLPTLIMITGKTRETAKTNEAASAGEEQWTFVSNNALTRLKENRGGFAREFEEVLGIAVFFVDTREDGDVRLTLFEFSDGPARCVGIVNFITVLEDNPTESRHRSSEHPAEVRVREKNLQFPCDMAVWIGRETRNQRRFQGKLVLPFLSRRAVRLSETF